MSAGSTRTIPGRSPSDEHLQARTGCVHVLLRGGAGIPVFSSVAPWFKRLTAMKSRSMCARPFIPASQNNRPRDRCQAVLAMQPPRSSVHGLVRRSPNGEGEWRRGESEYSGVLKTRKLLDFMGAQEARTPQMAPFTHVLHTRFRYAARPLRLSNSTIASTTLSERVKFAPIVSRGFF
jgi:hypothetical protein